MTAYVESFHTHAGGASNGWAGNITHPAHLKKNWKPTKKDKNPLDPTTAYTLDVYKAPTLDDAISQINILKQDAQARYDALHVDIPAKFDIFKYDENLAVIEE